MVGKDAKDQGYEDEFTNLIVNKFGRGLWPYLFRTVPISSWWTYNKRDRYQRTVGCSNDCRGL